MSTCSPATGSASWPARSGTVCRQRWPGRFSAKINGHYMFPESHSHAFAITAYQAAWLKCHYPLEFFVALLNNQPMGFYPLETIKQDARRCGRALPAPLCEPQPGGVYPGGRRPAPGAAAHPGCRPSGGAGHRTGTGPARPLPLRWRPGAAHRAATTRRAIIGAGPARSNGLTPDRRAALWEAELPLRPARNGQVALPVSTTGRVPRLPDFTAHEQMAGEYRVLGLYPRGHLMEFVRSGLGPDVLRTVEVGAAWRWGVGDGGRVAGGPAASPRTGRHGVRDH